MKAWAVNNIFKLQLLYKGGKGKALLKKSADLDLLV
jgi:hypothetical protein